MSLYNIETEPGHKNNNLFVNSMSFLAESKEPIDRYEEYLTRGKKSKNTSSDPRNLFDDSNAEDKNWLKIAKKFLSRPVKE